MQMTETLEHILTPMQTQTHGFEWTWKVFEESGAFSGIIIMHTKGPRILKYGLETPLRTMVLETSIAITILDTITSTMAILW
jgi:hypothetical protein